MPTLTPATANELSAIVTAMAADGTRLEIVGGGSKAAIGQRERVATRLAMTGFSGVVDYDPAELVLTARAATPLEEIEQLVAGANQMLAFEPFDHAPLFGEAPGSATIGGIVAAGVAGSRRVSAGGARDHLLGFTAVSGRGERFVAGAKVVKNVTGYDLPKLMCGSWGRLAALTEVTLKVLPRPAGTMTCAIAALSPARAVTAMAAAMGSQASVAAAGHGPGGLTALRLEGVAPSIRARRDTLARVLGAFGTLATLDDAAADAFWSDLRTLAPLGDDAALWRISVPAREAAALVADVAGEARWLMDWAGGLVWLASADDPARLRAAAAAAGGHAMLVRPGEYDRVPVFHPQPAPLAALETRVRRAFDPAGVFETGRFGGGDAD